MCVFACVGWCQQVLLLVAGQTCIWAGVVQQVHRIGGVLHACVVVWSGSTPQLASIAAGGEELSWFAWQVCALCHVLAGMLCCLAAPFACQVAAGVLH